MTGKITRFVDLWEMLWERDEDSPTTTDELLHGGGEWIDRHLQEWPTVLYQVEGDERWYLGTVTFVLEEATPEFVKDQLEQLAEMEAEDGAEAEEEGEAEDEEW